VRASCGALQPAEDALCTVVACGAAIVDHLTSQLSALGARSPVPLTWSADSISRRNPRVFIMQCEICFWGRANIALLQPASALPGGGTQGQNGTGERTSLPTREIVQLRNTAFSTMKHALVGSDCGTRSSFVIGTLSRHCGLEPRVTRSSAEVASRSPVGRQVARSPGSQVAR
jgi:hypothetical protein